MVMPLTRADQGSSKWGCARWGGLGEVTLVEPGEGGSPGGATNPEPDALPPSVDEHGRQRHGWGSPLDSKLRERRGRGRGGGSTRCGGAPCHRRLTVTRAKST